MPSPIKLKKSSDIFYLDSAMKDLKNEYGKFLFIDKFRQSLLAKRNRSCPDFTIIDVKGKELSFFDWISKANFEELQNAVWGYGMELTKSDLNAEDDFMSYIPKGLLSTEKAESIDQRYSIQQSSFGVNDKYKINGRVSYTEIEQI